MTLDILVVDDRCAKGICSEMKRFLIGEDIKYLAVDKEKKAIESIKKRTFDLVVLDYEMPEKNGYELARELRLIRKDIKIAGFSVYWTQKEAEEAGLVLYNTSLSKIADYISENLLSRKLE